MPDRFYQQLTRILGSTLLLLPLWVQAQTDNWYRVELLIFSNPAGSASEEWEATPELAYPELTRFLSDPDQSVTASPGEGASALFAPPQQDPGDPDTTGHNPARPEPFATLPATEQEFRGTAAQMQRSGRYRKLFHQAWAQPIGRQSEALSIVLDRSGDEEQWPALQGTIKLYVSRYLYLETNLWLNTSGEYLQSSWRMPAPPLGPATTVSIDEFLLSEPEPLPQQPSPTHDVQAAQFSPLEVPSDMEALEPVYPYAHAVLLKQTRRMRSKEVNYIDHPMFGVVVKVTPLSTAEPGS
jgi:hypothetical protein